MSKKKASAADAKKILEYMKEQNRPYNAQTIFLNLHNAVTKTATANACADLAAKGVLVEKIKGKQKIYWVSQDDLECLDPDALRQLDEESVTLREELKNLQSEVNSLSSETSALSSELTEEQLDAEIERLTEENEGLDEKLTSLTDGSDLVTPEQKEKITQGCTKNKAEWRKRKKSCMEIVDTICSSTNKKPKWLLDQAGLETDEEAGVSLDKTEKKAVEPPTKKRKTK
eukprot:TRINITY_DN17938_c0_g1_i1.p1 TRINITY_DN17938_c0_g1~~TRINITY_DN17938_c0_g1_i1.p1  ORF type:complete len:229 (-),score=61.58 TRINITY_DN17938_c0_g1_i1:41-727(-)